MASLLLTPGEGFRYKMCLEISRQKLLGGVSLLIKVRPSVCHSLSIIVCHYIIRYSRIPELETD